MMENTAIILIIITLFLLVIIVSLLTMLLFKMMKQGPSTYSMPGSQPTGEAPHPDISKSQFHPGIVERMKEIQKVKPRRLDLFCPNHLDEPGEVTCSICDKLFCKSCIKPFKNLHFCKEHIPLIMQNDWDEVITIKTSTTDPEQGVRLYDIKKEIFQKDDIPAYVETHYKINVDQDYIETYLVLFGIKKDIASLKEKISHYSFEKVVK